MSSQTVLIPIEFPDPDPLPSTFIDTLTSCKVILLGVYELPADTSADERQRREIEAYRSLYTTASSFVQEGETAEVELRMGTELEDAPATVAKERDVDALLIPNPITTLGHLLVALREEKFKQPITDFLDAINEEVLLRTTLFHVAETEDDVAVGEQLLTEIRDHLVQEGFSRPSIDITVEVSDDPASSISQAARNQDLIIMGETQETPSERIFGRTYDQVAEQTDSPVLIIRE
ncbi:universal stress protein [Haloarcula amylovorans]|uniref:universal stress protein n=1 Tax=Haloarcula amylovorans TaxID=2562280 RepID=UPI001076632D|nr:universal stress protein [Halomicroarcula amylolytica]